MQGGERRHPEGMKGGHLKMGISLDRVTVQDCIEMYDRKDFGAILSNGRLLGFRAELKGRSPAAGREPVQGNIVKRISVFPL